MSNSFLCFSEFDNLTLEKKEFEEAITEKNKEIYELEKELESMISEFQLQKSNL
jgi:predicted RNase H-like nuclease (RuvC/YqgF family)